MEGFYYSYSENEGTDQLPRSYCAADLRLCFRICKKPFSHNEAHFLVTRNSFSEPEYLANSLKFDFLMNNVLNH